VPYEDVDNLPFMKSEEAHNLAVPQGCRQANPSPDAADWEAQGDAASLHARIDTGRIWLPPVLSASRTVDSPAPGRIEITDRFELTEPRAVTFFLNSPLPMSLDGLSASIVGTRIRLRVEAPWAVRAAEEARGVNWNYVPFRRLALTSPPARTHELRTALSFRERG
jgi:hypothetical protein